MYPEYLVKFAASALLALCTGAASATPLYDNGPVLGIDGKSVAAPGVATLGFGAQNTSGNALADDFTISGDAWLIRDIDFYAYQNNAKAFTLQTVSWSIMSGDVNSGNMVASGTTSLTDGGFLGYRVAANAQASTVRPIYRANADIADLLLYEGHYWLRWSFTGSLTSGPWQAPTADGRSGNAAQSGAGSDFNTLIDAGSQRTVELPFALNGTVPEPSTPLLVLIAGVGLFGAMRLRRR